MRSTRFRTAAALIAALALTATACGGDDETGGSATDAPTTPAATGDATTEPGDVGEITTISAGTLTVCSEIPYPPFEFEDPDTGEFTGFDIDLITAVAEELGLEASVVNTGFEGIQSGAAMAARQCDIAASALTITEERAANLDFTDPYFQEEFSLLVKADSGIATLADLAGKNIGVQSETTGADYAAENAPQGTSITDFSGGADAIIALQAGQVDAVLQDTGPNAEAAANDDSLEIVEVYESDAFYGFAIAKGQNDALLAAVNGALETLRSDGTYDTLFEKYFPGA
jgi:polar amino acid transport system substrate-binding protein